MPSANLRLLPSIQSQIFLAFSNFSILGVLHHYRKASEDLSISKLKGCIHSHHKSLILRVSAFAYLLATSSIFQHRVGPFKGLIKFGKLAHRLQMPPLMKIRRVILVAQLEPAPGGADPYQRQRNFPRASTDEEEYLEEDGFHVERINDKQVVREKPRYLFKWRDEGSEHNVWYSADNLKS